MKYFRIVKISGSEGFQRFYVEHRVRLFGLNLWWSRTWLPYDGGIHECMGATSETEAEHILARIMLDYRKKHEVFTVRTVREVKG